MCWENLLDARHYVRHWGFSSEPEGPTGSLSSWSDRAMKTQMLPSHYNTVWLVRWQGSPGLETAWKCRKGTPNAELGNPRKLFRQDRKTDEELEHGVGSISFSLEDGDKTGWTMAQEPNLAHHLYLYSLWAKNGSNIFKWLGKKLKRRIFHGMWKSCEIWISASINKVL